MRIAVDGRALAGGRGIARYARTLLDVARARSDDEFEVLAARSAVARRVRFGFSAVVGRPRLETLAAAAPDVVWLPAPAPVALGVPYVLTLHDLSWLQRPQDFTRYERAWHALARIERLTAGARVVLCDSAATRAAALGAWPSLDAARLRVLAPAVAPLPEPRRDRRLPARYVLCVGALEPRKAPEVLLRAFAIARARGLDAELVFAGDGRLREVVRGPGVHVLSDLDDAALAGAYAGALALAMPSRLEGFGLPPLEALACGTPAIVSELPVFRETLGDDGALFCGDAEAFAAAMLAVGARRDALVRAGRARLARFAPEAAADGLLAALREVAA